MGLKLKAPSTTKQERSRLQRAEAKQIEARLKKMGLTATMRSGRVNAWKGDTFVVSFYWVTNKGWRMDLAQPTLYAKSDLDPAMDEIKTALHARDEADKAWAEFAKTRSEKAWKQYQGVLAAHYLRHWAGTTP